MASKIIRNAAVSLFPKRMQIVEAFLAWPETPIYWDLSQEIGHKSTRCDTVVPSRPQFWVSKNSTQKRSPCLDEFLAAPWRVIRSPLSHGDEK
jgi:hypothetical protein